MRRLLGLLAFSACAAFAQTPVVTEILNNYGLVNAGTVAQGAIFIAKGIDLSDQTTTLQSAPLQTTLVGVRMEITVAGVTTFAPMYYALPQQLAGILPSNTPTGTGTLVVRNNGRSSVPRPITVVRSAFGMLTINGAGTGMAAVHDAITYQLLANNSSTNPGKYLIFYGSGVGPTAGNETVAQEGVNASGDLTNIPTTVTIGGKSAQVLYRGRTTFPGLDQINVVVPTLDSYSCDVPVVITTDGRQANPGSIPVAQNGTICSTPNPGGGGGSSTGLTQGEIDAILARRSYRSGGFSISRTTTYTTIPSFTGGAPTTTTTRGDIASASFSSVSGPDLPLLFGASALPPGFTIPAPGVCNFFDTTNIPIVGTNLTYIDLDAGDPLTVRGPAGSRTVPRQTSQQGHISYYTEAGNGTPGNFMDPGNYTFSGPGGNVGSFSLSVDVAPELIWTNRTSSSVINRASGLRVTWTGGEPSQLVFIGGSSIVASLDGGMPTGASFQCYANQSAGFFDIPSSILTRLPPTTETVIPGVGSFVVVPGTLTLSSVGKVTYGKPSGLDSMSVTSASSVGQSVTYR